MNEDMSAYIVIGVACLMAVLLLVGASLVIRDTIRRKGKWGLNFSRVTCPNCGEPAPLARTPKNSRQAMWGGATCEECDCEFDKWGNKIDEAAK